MGKDKFINLFTDFGFKKIFGEEPNKDLLISFINTLLRGKEQITDLTYLNKEHLGATIEDRKAVFDLYCTNQNGEKIIVEIQRIKQDFFKDRSIYYAAFAIREQAKIGKSWNYELKSVYMIAILDFIFEDTLPTKLLHRIKLIDEETQEIFYHKLTYIYVEIPKFDKDLKDLKDDYERWLFAFKNLHKLRDKPDSLQMGIFRRLMELAEIAKMNPKEQSFYQESLKQYWDLKSSMDTYYNEGKQAGITETALKALKKGFDVDTVAEITGLSVVEIQQLKIELGL